MMMIQRLRLLDVYRTDPWVIFGPLNTCLVFIGKTKQQSTGRCNIIPLDITIWAWYRSELDVATWNSPVLVQYRFWNETFDRGTRQVWPGTRLAKCASGLIVFSWCSINFYLRFAFIFWYAHDQFDCSATRISRLRQGMDVVKNGVLEWYLNKQNRLVCLEAYRYSCWWSWRQTIDNV